MGKKTLAVIFGGRSSEHEVSCMSAQTVIRGADREKYDLLLIGITKDGRWLLVDSIDDIADGTWTQSTAGAFIAPDASLHGAVITDENGTRTVSIDVAFPIMHGLYGEDGTIQGLFELAQIPYVGCGVLASAVSMDKVYTKQLVGTLGIAQAAYTYVTRDELEDMEAALDRVESEREYPVFVKPSNAGSSRGVSKASGRDSLRQALLVAAAEDRKILVEETIVGRELECAVFSAGKPAASGVGEILAAAEFYDYDAKYNNAESRTVIGPELPAGKAEEIREDAVRIFTELDGYGLSRVDFFLEKGTDRVVFNEINTMPGFTRISMYPMLWAAAGTDVTSLIDDLIESAFDRQGPGSR